MYGESAGDFSDHLTRFVCLWLTCVSNAIMSNRPEVSNTREGGAFGQSTIKEPPQLDSRQLQRPFVLSHENKHNDRSSTDRKLSSTTNLNCIGSSTGTNNSKNDDDYYCGYADDGHDRDRNHLHPAPGHS